jgi:hypothetical protein
MRAETVCHLVVSARLRSFRLDSLVLHSQGSSSNCDRPRAMGLRARRQFGVRSEPTASETHRQNSRTRYAAAVLKCRWLGHPAAVRRLEAPATTGHLKPARAYKPWLHAFS